jgi:hypothetical protein
MGTTILPVVLYGCETRYLTLREQHRLGVFENKVLRRKVVPKRYEVTGQRRKLRNEKLRDLYSSSSITRMIKSRRMRLVGHVARIGENRNAYTSMLFVSEPEGNRPLESSTSMWEGNISTDLGEIMGWQGLNCSGPG